MQLYKHWHTPFDPVALKKWKMAHMITQPDVNMRGNLGDFKSLGECKPQVMFCIMRNILSNLQGN